LIQQERDELDQFIASNAYIAATSSPRPTYIPIEDKNRAFQEYIYMYLRNIHVDLDAFVQRMTFQDQAYSKKFSSLERDFHQKVISHIQGISKYLMDNVICTFPLSPDSGMLPPADVLWDTMELKRECVNGSIASTLKFDIAYAEVQKMLAPFLSSEMIRLFHVWNKWLTLQFGTMELLSTFNGYKKLKAHLEFLQKTFHQSFLPQRYETEAENRYHALAVEIYQLFSKKVSEKQVGSCSRILEHGTQVNDYLSSSDHFSSDMDICIEVSTNKKNFDDLKCAFQESVEEIHKIYPKRLVNFEDICQADDKKYFLFKLEFDNNYKIDCQISLNPFEKTCPGRMIPYAMLGYNLLTKTIYNPIHSFDLKELFYLINGSPEQTAV